MKKIITILVVVSLILVSFSGCVKPADEANEVTINGTWTLSTIQGVSASLASSSGSLTVTNGTSFTQQMTLGNLVGSPYSGTVTKISDSLFDLLEDGSTIPERYTLSSDGKTLSCNHQFYGELTFTK